MSVFMFEACSSYAYSSYEHANKILNGIVYGICFLLNYYINRVSSPWDNLICTFKRWLPVHGTNISLIHLKGLMLTGPEVTSNN